VKKCIVQYWIPSIEYSEPDYNKILKDEQSGLALLSAKSFQAYADKYGYDFIRIQKKKLGFRHPTFERFDLWLDDAWWEKYDEILYVDSDVFAMPTAPDIFAQYPAQGTLKVCVHPGFQLATEQEQIDHIYHGLLKECTIQQVTQNGFQAGVFIITKEARELMKPYIAKYKELNDHDGHILLWATIKSGVPLTRMTELYNFKNAFMKNKPSVHFFHAAGHKKHNLQLRILSFLRDNGIK